ncbi:MAG TPA: glycosyltransferase family 39 protein [Acidimicrobiales bacterium]|nr:glycosyltransferase family 39 protein [Acidimicrobiales bacterium]
MTDEPMARRVVAVATAVAAMLVAFRLGDKSFWVDEAFTISHASTPASEFFDVLVTREANGAIHSVMEFALVRVDRAEWWLRLPSALAFVATVPLVHLLTRRLFGARVGALAAVLMALNAFALEYGQQARVYALFMAASTMSTWLFVRYVQDGGRRGWLAWVVSASVLPYLHFFGLLVIGTQMLVSFVVKPTERRGDRLLGGFLVAVVAAIPLAAFFVLYGDEGQAVGIPPLSPVRLAGVFVRLAGNGGIPLAIGVTACALVAVVKIRPDRQPLHDMSTEAWGLVVLLSVLVVPVVVVALLSPVLTLFGARYFIAGAPALAGITALGVSKIDRSSVRVGAVVMLVVAGAAATGFWFARDPVEDVDTALADIAPLIEPGDGVVFVPYFMRLPVNAYAPDVPEVEQLDLVWPVTGWGELNIGHPDFATAGDYARAAEVDRVWLVIRDDFADAADDLDLAGFREALEADHDRVFEAIYPGFRIERYDRN